MLTWDLLLYYEIHLHASSFCASWLSLITGVGVEIMGAVFKYTFLLQWKTFNVEPYSRGRYCCIILN